MNWPHFLAPFSVRRQELFASAAQRESDISTIPDDAGWQKEADRPRSRGLGEYGEVLQLSCHADSDRLTLDGNEVLDFGKPLMVSGEGVGFGGFEALIVTRIDRILAIFEALTGECHCQIAQRLQRA